MLKETFFYVTGHSGDSRALAVAAQVDAPEHYPPPMFIAKLHFLWFDHWHATPLIKF
jgi:predicted lipase